MDNRGKAGCACYWYGVINLDTLEETDTCAHQKNNNGPCTKDKCPEPERFEGGVNDGNEDKPKAEVHL